MSGVIAKCIEYGVDPLKVGMYTLHEAIAHCEAKKEQRINSYNDAVTVAYLNVFFERQKRLPNLNDYLINEKEEEEEDKNVKSSTPMSEEQFVKFLMSFNASMGGVVKNG